MPLEPGADVDIANAMRAAGLGKAIVKTAAQRERAGQPVN
jgi:hypothetical protein